MGWREALARKICPDLGKRADRYWFVSIRKDEAKWWLSEFKDVFQTLDYLEEAEAWYFGDLDAGKIGTMRIEEFRKRLREQHKSGEPHH